MNEIIEQLKSYCNCIDIDEEEVLHLIELISMATCWTHEPCCETFLFSSRREVIELPSCNDKCNVIAFEPYYKPFETDSFTFTLIEQKGIEEKSTSIEGAYSEVDGNFKLNLSAIKDCHCKTQCGCETTYKLLVTYDAGYITLPDCIVPVMCEALKYLHNDGGCASCNTDYEAESVYVGDGATINDRLDDYFGRVLFRQHVRELGLISLCEKTDDIWGIIV